MRTRSTLLLLWLCLPWAAHPAASDFSRPSDNASPVLTADKVLLSYFDSMEWSYAHSCAAHGSFLLVGMQYGVLVLDVSNPALPVEVARLPLSGPAISLFIQGNLAYASCAQAGIYIIDISEPLEPMVLRHEETPGVAREVLVDGSYLYLADDFAGLRILDVSAPQSPTLLDSLAFPLLNRVRGLDLQWPYLLLAASQVVRMVNVSNPADVTFAGEYASGDVAWDVVADGAYAYVANGTNAMPILSIANPDSLQEVAHIDTPDYARRIAAQGGYAYVADETGGLKVFNVSDPLTPSAAGIGSAYAVDVTLAGQRAFTAGELQGVAVFDLTDPAQPSLLGRYDTDRGGRRLEIRGNRLFMLDASNGLSILDISDARHPALLGRYEGLGWGDWAKVRMAVNEEVAVIGSELATLELVDISDPTQPTKLAEYFPPYYWDVWPIQDLELKGDTLYVLDSWYAGALDISDPSSPQFAGVSGAVIGCCAQEFVVNGTHAYVAGEEEGIGIFDLTGQDPFTWIGNTATTGSADALVTEGTTAYVLDSEAGLVCYDIGQPDTLVLLGALPLPWRPESMRVTGKYAYLIHSDSGLVVADISKPATPELVGSFKSSGRAQDVAVLDHTVYLADLFAVSILDLSETTPVVDRSPAIPTDFRILNAYPNPFNASIAVKYVIDRPGRVRLTVYNSLGQRVRTLLDQEMSVGEHVQTWNGLGEDGIESGTGVYFLMLQKGPETAVRKAVLLK